ncbi:type II toxin-antitoxin system prevent-host-death family antitoxin [Embleya sp. NPDC005971]|uniref:type II toxin-antitoxin system Phd/YefM family antitoxin n=1 Tax=Embleya sp. NPDC005971 TaxID=3156724 RepID=UPI0033C9E176
MTLMYMKPLEYDVDMTAPKAEHDEPIAQARNNLSEVINRARYLGEPTFLLNRGKRVAVVVGTDFYEQALADRARIESLET